MTQQIKVGGMRCEHCKKRMENAFLKENISASADIASGIVTIEAELEVPTEKLKSMVEELGFDFIKSNY